MPRRKNLYWFANYRKQKTYILIFIYDARRILYVVWVFLLIARNESQIITFDMVGKPKSYKSYTSDGWLTAFFKNRKRTINQQWMILFVNSICILADKYEDIVFPGFKTGCLIIRFILWHVKTKLTTKCESSINNS